MGKKEEEIPKLHSYAQNNECNYGDLIKAYREELGDKSAKHNYKERGNYSFTVQSNTSLKYILNLHKTVR